MDNRYGGEPIPDLIVVSVVVLLPIVKKWNCQSTDCQRSKTNVSQIACLCSNFDQRMPCYISCGLCVYWRVQISVLVFYHDGFVWLINFENLFGWFCRLKRC